MDSYPAGSLASCAILGDSNMDLFLSVHVQRSSVFLKIWSWVQGGRLWSGLYLSRVPTLSGSMNSSFYLLFLVRIVKHRKVKMFT